MSVNRLEFFQSPLVPKKREFVTLGGATELHKTSSSLCRKLCVKKEDLEKAIIKAIVEERRVTLLPIYRDIPFGNLGECARELIRIIYSTNKEDSRLRTLQPIKIDPTCGGIEEALACAFSEKISTPTFSICLYPREFDAEFVGKLLKEGQNAIVLIRPSLELNEYYFAVIEITSGVVS